MRGRLWCTYLVYIDTICNTFVATLGQYESDVTIPDDDSMPTRGFSLVEYSKVTLVLPIRKVRARNVFLIAAHTPVLLFVVFTSKTFLNEPNVSAPIVRRNLNADLSPVLPLGTLTPPGPESSKLTLGTSLSAGRTYQAPRPEPSYSYCTAASSTPHNVPAYGSHSV